MTSILSLAKLHNSHDTMIAKRDDLGDHTIKACLVKIHPAGLGEGLIELPTERFMIGRDVECNLALPEDKAVSRNHALINHVAGEFVLHDENSTNGTYVNDEPIRERTLVTGDQIRVGGHIFKFLCNDVEAQYHQTIYSMIVTDGLTGVHSPRYFQEAIERELVRSQRHARPLALVILDIDHFKEVNDTHTHLVGNEVLRAMCHRIAPSIRRDEVFARWGGEEFVILLPESTHQEATQFAERIRRLVADAPFDVGEMSLPITISLGVGFTDGRQGYDAESLIREADSHLLAAKAAGRNRVCSDQR